MRAHANAIAAALTVAAIAAISAILLSSCIGTVTPACAFDADCSSGQVCVAAVCREGTRAIDGGVCEQLSPSFADINANFFQVGCRVKDSNCHSSDAVLASSGLDLSGDPYPRLVGIGALNQFGICRCDSCDADGGCTGQPLLLVKPGDSAHSYLVIKLSETADSDQTLYGGGMPADAPGSTCAASQAAIAQWIDQGAGQN